MKKEFIVSAMLVILVSLVFTACPPHPHRHAPTPHHHHHPHPYLPHP